MLEPPVAVQAGKTAGNHDRAARRPEGGRRVLVEVKATGICHTDDSPCRVADTGRLFRRSSAMKGAAWSSMSARA